jgi:hypothetical protein
LRHFNLRLGLLLASLHRNKDAKPMQEAEKSNVVDMRDYAQRRSEIVRGERAAAGSSRAGELLDWPKRYAPYPGGIDDLPV